VQWTQPNNLPILGPLSAKDAQLLYYSVNPAVVDANEQEALTLLLQEMDHVPLAVVIMAQVGTGESCSHMLSRWKEEKTCLLHAGGSKADRLTSVQVSISMSLKSLVMTENPDAVELLSLICHLPDGLLAWHESIPRVGKAFKRPYHLVNLLCRATWHILIPLGH
jgi:hypothetical protein